MHFLTSINISSHVPDLAPRPILASTLVIVGGKLAF